MGESLMQQRRVSDEGFRIVKLCRKGKNRRRLIPLSLIVPYKKAPANFVPAAAVIRGVQALFGITGRKACVGGHVSQM